MFQSIPVSQSEPVEEIPQDLIDSVDGSDQTPVEPVQGSDEGSYITRKDLEAIKADILEQSRRQAQSYADQTASRVDKRIREELVKVTQAVALMKANGIDVSDAQVETMRQKAFAKAYEGSDALPSPEGSSPAQTGKDAPTTDTVSAEDHSFVQRSLARLNKKLGGQLLPTDPEAEGMDQISNADDFVEAYEANLQRKLARTATPAAARVASAVQGGKTTSPTVASLTAELEHLMEKPNPANLPRMREINLKLDQLRAGVTR